MTRLGLIVPSSNTTIEPEFCTMLTKGFTVHAARVRQHWVNYEGLAQMEENIEGEAAKLADANVDAIAFACTSGSFIKGLGHDRIIEKKIEKASGKPGVATAGAAVSALKALKIHKVAVATPYIAEINKLEEEFLKANGFSVVDLKGLELSDNIEIGRVENQTTIKLVNNLKHEGADGIFISCTNLPTVGIIKELENRLKKPVISSNTATLWALLKKCNISAKIRGYGKLLEEI